MRAWPVIQQKVFIVVFDGKDLSDRSVVEVELVFTSVTYLGVCSGAVERLSVNTWVTL